MAEADLEVGELVHHAAGHQRRERHRAVREVADGVGQVIAGAPRRHDRVPALVEEDERAQLLRGLPEGAELGLLERPSIDVVVDLDALEASWLLHRSIW